MKFKYIVVALLAALISYGGAGVNFISYCCNDCRSEGVEVVMNDKCCDIHHHEHNKGHNHNHALHSTPDCCNEHLNETDCCTLERIDFEWDQTVNPVFNFQPVGVDLLSAVIPAVSLLPDTELVQTLFIRHDGPPQIVCPRVYLSLLTTLLI